MPHLIDLPAELLIQVFAASDAILDALHLSATNRLLHAVWLEHSKPIVESILKPTLPAFDEAVQLAYTEVQLESTESSIDSSPSFRGCLPTLLQNADLCASVCLAYSSGCKDAALPAVSYYFLRRIGLEIIHYQLRDDIYLELRSMSTEELMLLATDQDCNNSIIELSFLEYHIETALSFRGLWPTHHTRPLACSLPLKLVFSCFHDALQSQLRTYFTALAIR